MFSSPQSGPQPLALCAPVGSGYEEDTMQVFQERLREFLAEDFRSFSVEVDKGAGGGGEILRFISSPS